VSESMREAAGGERAGSDWVALTKPRIASFIFFAAMIGGLLAGGTQSDWPRILEQALYVTLAAGAGSIFNQVLERDTDARMQRTRLRPIAAGRISVRDAVFYGALMATIGVAGLAARFNLISALLAASTLFAYVAVYTPLKRVSTLNTVVGAIPGAAPPLLGYVAMAGDAGRWAWALFGLIFVWQFPHFMAIAWIYREDYARAGLRMLPSVPGGVGIASRSALVYSLVLIPVALVPAVYGDAGLVYGIGALVASLVYAAAALRFAWKENLSNARLLLYTSLIYLPVLLSLAVLDPTARGAAVWAAP
jgi:protoheme IX farnesyltransferase